MADRERSRLVFSGPIVRIGAFRCPPGHPAWERENRTDHHLVVFPRVGVGIAHAGGPAVTADPNCVMFYNPGQVYRRRLLCERGDVCEWFNISASTLADAAAPYDPAAREHGRFPFSHGPSSPRSYLIQRRLFHLAVAAQSPPDPLGLEETFLAVLNDVVARAYEAHGRRPARARTADRSHRDAAENLKALLAVRAGQRLTLDELSDAVELSPFHLCRVFRQRTGVPIHRYLTRLRLRAALERLGDPATSLTRIALDLGFSSHAHFTTAFGREFGMTPSRARAELSGRLIARLSKILEAAPPAQG